MILYQRGFLKFVSPNDGFLAQLAVFHSAKYKRTQRNKETRAFYVQRAVKEVLSTYNNVSWWTRLHNQHA